jgi:hypothetical protein
LRKECHRRFTDLPVARVWFIPYKSVIDWQIPELEEGGSSKRNPGYRLSISGHEENSLERLTPTINPLK